MGIRRCITEATPDRGRCTNEQCTCPDASDARVIASAGPYAGESAPVVEGVATFAHTGTATLALRGPAAGAILSRVERDGDVVVGRIPTDGVRRGLVAGTYQLTVSVEDGMVELAGIGLKDGELREVTLALPDDEVDVAWRDTRDAPLPPPETAMFVVEAPDLRATWWRSPARVVPGATLWACVDTGCCRFVNPGPSVTCTPDPSITPPLPR